MESIVRLIKRNGVIEGYKHYETPDGKLIISIYGHVKPLIKTDGTAKKITVKDVTIYLDKDGSVQIFV